MKKTIVIFFQILYASHDLNLTNNSEIKDLSDEKSEIAKLHCSEDHSLFNQDVHEFVGRVKNSLDRDLDTLNSIVSKIDHITRSRLKHLILRLNNVDVKIIQNMSMFFLLNISIHIQDHVKLCEVNEEMIKLSKYLENNYDKNNIPKYNIAITDLSDLTTNHDTMFAYLYVLNSFITIHSYKDIPNEWVDDIIPNVKGNDNLLSKDYTNSLKALCLYILQSISLNTSAFLPQECNEELYESYKNDYHVLQSMVNETQGYQMISLVNNRIELGAKEYLSNGYDITTSNFNIYNGYQKNNQGESNIGKLYGFQDFYKKIK